MTTDAPIIPRFIFSSAAIAAIEDVRQQYLRHSPDDPPVRLGIFLGHRVNQGLEQIGPDTVCLAFWRKSEYPLPDREPVHSASGLDFVFAVLQKDRHLFENKVIDHSAARAFFLRPTP